MTLSTIIRRLARFGVIAGTLVALVAPNAAVAGHDDFGPHHAIQMIHGSSTPHPDDAYRPGVGAGVLGTAEAATRPLVAADDGFGWNDAAIGAAAMLGIVLAGVGGLALARQGRGRVTSA